MEGLFHSFHGKIYIFGFLYHRLPSTTHSLWVKVWAELWGSVLVIWKVPESVLSEHRHCYFDTQKFIAENLHPSEKTLSEIKACKPIHVHLFDSVSELLGNLTFSGAIPPAPFSSYFALCPSSSSVHYFATYSTLTANEWIVAIRLAEFELQKLSHCNSMQLLNMNKECWSFFELQPWQTNSISKIHFIAPVKLKFTYSSEWKDFTLIILSNKVMSVEQKRKELPKKTILGLEIEERAQILFYEPGIDPKKLKPVYFLPAPVSISASWPEKSSLIEKSSIGRIDGAVFPVPTEDITKNKDRPDYTTEYQYIDRMSIHEVDALSNKRPIPSFTLFMAKNVTELLKIILAISLAFKLDLDYQKIQEEVAMIHSNAPMKHHNPSSMPSGSSESESNSTEEESTEDERHSSGYEQSDEDFGEISDNIGYPDEATKYDKNNLDSMDQDEFSNQKMRPKPKSTTEPFSNRTLDTENNSQLFLLTSEVSGISMYHEAISMSDPLSKLSKIKSDFNAVWLLKLQAKRLGLLHEWEKMVMKNLTQRKVLEEKAAQAKLKDWMERFEDLSKKDSPTQKLQSMFPKIQIRDGESDSTEDSEQSGDNMMENNSSKRHSSLLEKSISQSSSPWNGHIKRPRSTQMQSDSSGNIVLSSQNQYSSTSEQMNPNTLLGAINMSTPQVVQSPQFSPQTLLGKVSNQSKQFVDGPYIDIEDSSTIHVERGLIQDNSMKKKLTAIDGPFIDPEDYSQILLERGVLQESDIKKPEFTEPVFDSNTLVGQIKERPTTMMPLIQPFNSGTSIKSGTLLDSMQKPKVPVYSQPSNPFETGLLAEAQKKSKEEKEWKKNLTHMANTSGIFTPRTAPTTTESFQNEAPLNNNIPVFRPNIPHSPRSSDSSEETPEAIYYREMLRQQFLMHERLKEQQRMLEQQQMALSAAGYLPRFVGPSGKESTRESESVTSWESESFKMPEKKSSPIKTLTPARSVMHVKKSVKMPTIISPKMKPSDNYSSSESEVPVKKSVKPPTMISPKKRQSDNHSSSESEVPVKKSVKPPTMISPKKRQSDNYSSSESEVPVKKPVKPTTIVSTKKRHSDIHSSSESEVPAKKPVKPPTIISPKKKQSDNHSSSESEIQQVVNRRPKPKPIIKRTNHSDEDTPKLISRPQPVTINPTPEPKKRLRNRRQRMGTKKESSSSHESSEDE